MIRLIRLFLMAITFSAPLAVDAAPVTWDFYETGCVAVAGGYPCTPPNLPFLLATLVLPDVTSSGSARWSGDPAAAPVYTGTDFALSFQTMGHPGLPTLTQSFPGDRDCGGGGSICSFDVSWNEVGGRLLAVAVSVLGFSDELHVDLTGGYIGSDDIYGGCALSQCRVSGFWQSDLAVPEPISVLMLMTGILAAWLASPLQKNRILSP
ncbi:MAG: hypothetical protein JO307_15490 [Bryobacterales bacterium]|nr:hypothetical protein [Bryobacterales bacterium]